MSSRHLRLYIAASAMSLTLMSCLVAAASPRPSALLVALIGVTLSAMMPVWTGSQRLATAGTARRS